MKKIFSGLIAFCFCMLLTSSLFAKNQSFSDVSEYTTIEMTGVLQYTISYNVETGYGEIQIEGDNLYLSGNWSSVSDHGAPNPLIEVDSWDDFKQSYQYNGDDIDEYQDVLIELYNQARSSSGGGLQNIGATVIR